VTAGPGGGPSRRDALRRSTALLSDRGLGEAAGDARFLLLGILGLETRDLLVDGDRRLAADEAAALDAALARRLAGEPVARILGAWEFWGLPFRLGPDTLVPRPDTETLVAVALAAATGRTAPPRCLDLGTGSGCILTAILHELPAACGIGVDRSEAALRVARHNAVANGIGERAAFLAGDWCDAIGGSFDLIVSNPPYIGRSTPTIRPRRWTAVPTASTPTVASSRGCAGAISSPGAERWPWRSASTKPTRCGCWLARPASRSAGCTGIWQVVIAS
jgi:HemK-like putative methylase